MTEAMIAESLGAPERKLDGYGWHGVQASVCGRLVRVVLHNYPSQIERLDKLMELQGYRCLAVIATEFEYCQDGRELWYTKS